MVFFSPLKLDTGWLEFFCAVLGNQGIMREAGSCFTGPKRKEMQNRESRFNKNRKLLDPVGISWVHSLLLGHRVTLKWKWGKEKKKEVKRRTALKQNDIF